MKKALLLALLAISAQFAMAQITDTIVSLTPSNKNVILEEYTGVNCGYCPDGHKIGNQIAAANPGRVFLINVHTGSYAAQYNTQFGSALANQTGLTGYPSGTVNRHVFSGSSTALSRGSWSSCSSTILGQSSPVNIAAEGTLDCTTRELNLKVQLYYTASSSASTNMLNVAIVQDNVLGPQSGASYNPDQVVGNQYNHMHMLRHLITGQWGETITTTTAGTLVEKNYTYTIPAQFGVSGDMVDALLSDLKFIVFVAEGQQEILTGTEANVTYQNLPAIDILVSSLKNTTEASCDGSASVEMTVKNIGQNPLTSMTIQYQIASNTPQTFNWTGNIATMASSTIELPTLTINTNTDQDIKVTVISANGESYTSTEKSITIKKSVYECGGWMTLSIKTDKYGSENSFKVFNSNGQVVLQGGPFSNAPSTHNFDFNPSAIDCYNLVVYDSYGDGMGYTSGTFIKIIKPDGSVLFSSPGSAFSDQVSFNLNVTHLSGTGVEEVSANEISIYPNPATSTLRINAAEAINEVAIYNLQGQLLMMESGNVQSINISNLATGNYIARITTENGITNKRFIKE